MGFAAQSVSLIVSASIVAVYFSKRARRGAASLLVFALAIMLSALMLILGVVFGISPVVLGVSYAGILLALTMLFIFSLEYTRRNYWLTPLHAVMLSVVPILTFCIVWFGPPGWAFTVVNQDGVTRLFPNGFWMWITSIYIEFLVFLTILFLVRTYHGTYPFKRWSGWVILGALPSVFVPQVSLLGADVSTHLFLNLLAVSFTGAIFAYVFLYKDLLDILPVPREVVVDNMTDGWMVVDRRDRVVDMNPVAEILLGERHAVLGTPVTDWLSDWRDIVEGTDGKDELKLKGQIGMSNDRVLDVTAISIDDPHGVRLGRLVMWRDITQKAEREQARLRVQNEMYALMYSIVGEATRSQNLENFIGASIQQILHVFKCESGVVYLVNEDESALEPQLFLAAHYGLPLSPENKAQTISPRLPIIAELIETREPSNIPDASADWRLGALMGASVSGAVLLLPMISENRMIGVMGLLRKLPRPFSEDEVLRVSSVVEHVSNFVSGDRRRQLAITVAERQKLVRDLHDSVTQKLYGLVAFTEAAEAGLEAGSMDMLMRVLPRISENARQSLKEMRLFLHGLQPVDIEREGLEAVLHQRLAAVEGRADIKARFTYEEGIDIPIEKQVALYFIAQEALNNVMKHAKAKSVSVHLSQSRASIMLDIEDDGCGFDPLRLNVGGMGIRNMQQRARQVGGSVKIESTPGKGAKVRVNIPRENFGAGSK